MRSRSSRWIAGLAFLLIAFFPGGCGRKTDPLTPASPKPEAVQNIRAVTRDAYVFLSWPIPAKNVEGKEMNPENILDFRVIRAEVERTRKKLRFHEIARISLSNPAPAQIRSGMVFLKDGPLAYERVYAYRIIAESTSGGASPPSDEVRAAPLLSLAAPRNLSAEGGENIVGLAWSPVATRADGSVYSGFVGYNIYRRDEKGAYGDAPLNQEPVRTLSYKDAAVQNDKRYYYVVRAADSPALPWKESLDSEEVSAAPHKVTPPDRPAGLTVVPGITRVFLTWNENKERDLAGYHVYRTTKSGRNYERLTDKPIMRTTFSDETVKPGQAYYYAVSAVDQSGNESALSKEQKTYTEKVQ